MPHLCAVTFRIAALNIEAFLIGYQNSQAAFQFNLSSIHFQELIENYCVFTKSQVFHRSLIKRDMLAKHFRLFNNQT